MFGYVMANKDALSEEERIRFGAYYCGLCRTLGHRYGTLGRLSLSYEMTFLSALLTSLYEPETVMGNERCLLHPRKKQKHLSNAYIDYAADMTIVLTYHKARDDWKDDRSLVGYSRARSLRNAYKRIESQYPRQLAQVTASLEELDKLEKAGCSALDPLVNAFGDLLGELFVYHKDMWSDTLRKLGAAMGRFIYLMDAYDDLESDRKHGRFNPLLSCCEQTDFEQRTLDNLQLLLGEGTVAFEQLPLVQDLGILRNVLYSGVWTRYRIIRHKRFGEEAKA